jgi:hypothetical protein
MHQWLPPLGASRWRRLATLGCHQLWRAASMPALHRYSNTVEAANYRQLAERKAAWTDYDGRNHFQIAYLISDHRPCVLVFNL